ncbi:hypothetical protein P691DRAFT_676124 [Macrolepiota fuliginosa MF-IS2]|uniref:BTB domain-containing protein n=1 Tax=Macrolepiota fuliginosa MF-IS2 TaxID=1400762 RepID=A0A9P5X636_9AGAR|nr:hypothetical protein P691DRAFT_676124 [Macrolepiota fuliginosa MF-IS2]
MPEPFKQTAHVPNAIKNILENYPLLDGPLRELLQNSDDARATKQQIFILDRRNHSISALVGPEYIQYQQSPALIAYNDAYFEGKDWQSLKSIFDSSKTDDTDAFGQFGQGFRCVYHLTDCPQIFSGSTLALLNLPEGTTLNTSIPSDAAFTSHITAFGGLPGVPYPPSFATDPKTTESSNAENHPRVLGTVIRLPLRTKKTPKSLSTQCPTPEKINQLFDEFVKYDLECTLLFLKNVRRIEMYEVLGDGAENVREVCSVEVKEGKREGGGVGQGPRGEYTTERCVIESCVTLPADAPGHGRLGTPTPTHMPVTRASGSLTRITTTTWRTLECPFNDPPSGAILGRIPREYNPAEEMQRRKLNQCVRVAAPISFVTASATANASASTAAAYGVGYWRSGRLFSGLPLPRSNNKNWPIHVDARFAIPPSRQNIRSSLEGGFIGEWNSTLFTAFIPQAWTFLLHTLAREDKVKDIFEYWPPPGGPTDYIAPADGGSATRGAGAGGSGRSQGMLQTVFDCIVIAKPAVWPIYVAVPPPTPLSPSRLTSITPTPAYPQPIISTSPQASSPAPPPEFMELGNIRIAREDTHFPDLRNALADCGVRFTKPPMHFKNLIEGCKKRRFEFLEAQNVHKELLKNVDAVERAISATPKYAMSILDFLLKGQDIHFLVGLPLLKNVEGQYITLQRLATPSSAAIKQTLHPLLDAHSALLFKDCDPNAIALNELPHSIASVVKTKGPGVLNIVELTAEKVVSYLISDIRWTTVPLPALLPSSPTSPTPSSLTSSESTQYLAKFFSWLASQPFASSFLQIPEIRQLYIVPTHFGLKRIEDSVFDTVPMALGKCLRALGIGLLDLAIGRSARTFLADTGGVLKKVGDVKGVLDGAHSSGVLVNATATRGSDTAATSLGLTCLEWRSLHDYFVHWTRADQLNEEERRKLRLLPIYPLLDPTSLGTPTPLPGPIPDNKHVMGVNTVDILPIIDDRVFLDLRGFSTASYGILSLLDPSSSNAKPLTNTELLDLSVRNFGSQPPEIRVSIVTYAAKHEKKVPRGILERLWEKPIIMCRDGVERTPGEVVDPKATAGVGDIIATCARVDVDVDAGKVFYKYLPRLEGRADEEIMKGLRRLPICPLRTTLDQEMLLEVTAWISRNGDKPEASEVSRKLFRMLAMNPVYGEFVKAIPRGVRWIVTNLGLKASDECRDRNAQFALCDEVYALVDEDIHMTDVLRSILGWTQKLSHVVLFDQLDVTLRKGGDYTKVREIVNAIGSEELSEEVLNKLRGVLGEREWVPTKAGGLVRPENAVLEHAVDEAGFIEVSFNAAAYPKVVEFLRRMGVQDRPVTGVVLSRIGEFALDGLDERQLQSIVKLLALLPDNLSEEEASLIRVPDVDGRMRRVSDLHFNDTNMAANHLPREGTRAISHPYITKSLARKLRIEPLAKQLSKFSGYMGESFATSIRSVLKDYNETQMLIEMLANAADAGARRFIVILDEMPSSSEHLISPNLAAFQLSPALLVYNDARFTEDDFEGLCHTGEGSKRHKGHTIGQFGRGALTMFHLTEFPMLVSSGRAIFIDPSMNNLPDLPRNANNQRMDLDVLQRFYPGHLDFIKSLGGLLGYNGQDSMSFPGTMFRLPLKETDHIGATPHATWSTRDVRERILAPFKIDARSCLLFTQLESIQAYVRTREGDLEELWSFEATRPGTSGIDGDFQRRMVQTTEAHQREELWQTVSYIVPDRIIPRPWASALIAQHNLRHPKVELAALIRPEEAEYEEYHQKSVLFSTMPLAESVRLPVHCSATFITTSDRRHIRLQLDNDTSDQSKYNEWLLEEIVPQVYLYLLEFLLDDPGAPNHHFWPINESTPVDKIIVPALYERHLKHSNRRLFETTFPPQHHLRSSEIFILPSDSPVRPVVAFLSPENVAIYSEPFLSRITDDAGVPSVSPEFLRGEILKDPERLTRAFIGEQSQLSLEVLNDLLKFFLENDPPQLLGLPLLPLEDRSLANFANPRSGEPVYYVWKGQYLPGQVLANPRRLVKLDFEGDMLLNGDFNVEELKSGSMASLIEEIFPKRPDIEGSQWQQFISNFWDNFLQLQLEVKDIMEFPLVPTLSPDRYISLKVCKEGEVPIVSSLVPTLVCECLARLGVPIVSSSSPPCPPQLAHILQDENQFPRLRMPDILRGIDNIDPQVLSREFLALQTEVGEGFAGFSDWIKRVLFQDVPPRLVTTARSLPVWDAYDRHGVHTAVTAQRLIMLPEGLDEEIVAPYIDQRQIVIISPGMRMIFGLALKRLNVPLLSYHDLLALVELRLPQSMPDPDRRQEYRVFVEAILDSAPNMVGLQLLQLPSASPPFELQLVGRFYAREEGFFRLAFPEGSHHFVAPEFTDLEGKLGSLRRMQGIDLEVFVECVQSIDNNSSEEGGAMAFDILNDRLPSELINAVLRDPHQWNTISETEFVPRESGGLWRPGDGTEAGAEGTGLNVSQYVQRPFAELVALRDIVRQEYVSIAWSQRAVPRRALTEQLKRADPGLGCPSVGEVINHLRVLVFQVVPDHPNDPAVLSDLVATYRYLNEKAEESATDLADLREEALFLNVDNPREAGVNWVWEAPANLSFDVRDVGNFKSVRRFIHSYASLLVAAGALEVNHPPGRSASSATTTVDLGRMDGVRRKYEEMRRNTKLVDVKFVTRDDNPDDPLLGHRSFLAAHSDHFQQVFCSDFSEGQPASPEAPVELRVPGSSRACVALILEYIYTGIVPLSTPIGVLLDGLKLSKYWSIPELVECIQDCIIEGRLVDPNNLTTIQDAARAEDLVRLTEHCEEYAARNTEYISRANSQPNQ